MADNSQALVDSHCHLDLLETDRYEGGLKGILATARDMGVTRMLCVSISMERYPDMLALVEPYSFIDVTVGVHPNEREGCEPDVDELANLARSDKVTAIGETGLDYYRSTGDLEWQRERFRKHIAAAKSAGKPLVIHSRDAPDDTLATLEIEGAADAGGVMHCFVDDWDTAKRALDIGFYISFAGIVTFKNAQDLNEVARRVPMDRLLIETDSPFLAPMPYRGKPNQPAYVRYVAEHLAELRNVGVDELASTTTENYFRLFQPVA